MKHKAIFNWSGGKDSALALYKILQNPDFEIISLLTTINKETQQSSMHAIPLALLKQQAESIGLALYTIDLAANGDFTSYDQAMEKAVLHFKKLGVTHFAFGDIYLHDVRSYREKQLQAYGIQVVEPLWDLSVTEVMDEFLKSQLKTIITCITESMLSPKYLGKIIDKQLISTFPKDADICGENGEYHTFCYAGPLFKKEIKFITKESIRISNRIKMDDGSQEEFIYRCLPLSEK